MYKRAVKGWFKHLDFLIWDVLCMQVSFIIAYWIRHGISNPYEVDLYVIMNLMLVALDIIVLICASTLKNVLKRGYYKEFLATVRQVFIVFALAIVYMYMIKESDVFSRITLGFTGILYAVSSYIVRVLWKKHLFKKLSQAGSKRSMVVFTTSEFAGEVVETLMKHNYDSYRIAGLVLLDADRTGDQVADVPVVASRKDALDYIMGNWVDEAFFYLRPGRQEDLLRRQLSGMGVAVHLAIAAGEQLDNSKQFVENIGSYIVLTTSMNSAATRQIVCKRLMDIIGGLIGCAATCVLFLVVAPVIKCKSPGPVFFVQERVGKNGRKFKMYKFRSMYLDAEERKARLMAENKHQTDMMFKMDCDPRIIDSEKGPGKGFGNFIRRHSIDEMPQFFNVLKGDMSLVGTRPPTVDEWEKYELHHHARLAFKPGMTGLWQISGRSDITDFEEVVKLDTQYINEWDIGQDIKILLQTLWMLIKPVGAA